MRKTIIAALLLVTTAAFAQKISSDKVPAAVSKAFNQKYPKVAVIKWEMEKGNFEANFKDGVKQKSALIDPSGKILEDETSISTSALPQSVKSYVEKNYKNAKIKEAAYIVLASGQTQYEAEVNGEDLIFNADGKFLKAVKD